MAASKGSRIASLILRIITFILIFISLLINATNSKSTGNVEGIKPKVKYNDVYAYRYLVAVAVLGAALSLIQIVRTIYCVVTQSDGTPIVDFFSDKILSYLLLSGASAGLGAALDLKPVFKKIFGNLLNSFFDKGNAAAAILLLAFVCSAVVSVLSSLALIRKP